MSKLPAYQRATLQWLAGGDFGTSSRTMAFWLAFGIRIERADHPYDPSDLGRCLRLLKAVPRLRGRLYRMSDISPTWALMVANWRRLERLYWKEQPSSQCPRTYELMRSIRLRAELERKAA